jgi:hypothetical protein
MEPKDERPTSLGDSGCLPMEDSINIHEVTNYLSLPKPSMLLKLTNSIFPSLIFIFSKVFAMGYLF